MPVIYQRLTDRTLATGVTLNDLIHVVLTNDISQDPDGSSYKAELSQLLPVFSGLTFTGGSSNCITDLYVSNIHSCSPLIINPLDEGNVYFGSTSGITLDVINKRIGINTNNPQHSLHISGNTLFNGTLSATTISATTILATTYQNLPNTSVGVYFPLSGGTVSGTTFFTNGLSANTISATTYQNLPSLIGNYLPLSGGTVTGATRFTNGLTANTISADTLTITDNIDTTTRTLKNVSNNPTLDWSSLILYGTTANIYWDNGLLKDSGPNLSVDWVNRTLNDGNEDIILDWQNKIMSGMTSVQSSTISASTLNISSTPTTDTGTTTNYLTRDGSTGEVKVKTIPGSTVYGLFTQTGTSVAVSATTVESTLINNGIGTITVPANGFQVGDSFNGVLIGHLSCVGTATLQIRIKTTTGVLLADTGVISMNTATNKHWKLDVNFTIRQLGVASVGSIASGGLFSYTKNSGTNFEGTNFSIINNTTFDTTISNTLVVTAEWNTNNAGNSIYSEIFTLNKIY
jgi:hypothetical protein